jgi:hypothetical protein
MAYFVSQSSEFCRYNSLCCFSTSVYCCCCVFRYRLSPGTFGYTLVHARFEVFMKIQFVVFCIVAPCSVVAAYQRFGAPCCLHFQGWRFTARSSETMASNLHLSIRQYMTSCSVVSVLLIISARSVTHNIQHLIPQY